MYFPSLLDSNILEKELGITNVLHNKKIIRATHIKLLGLGESPPSPRNLQCVNIRPGRYVVSWSEPQSVPYQATSIHLYRVRKRSYDANTMIWSKWEDVFIDDEMSFEDTGDTRISPSSYEYAAQAWNEIGCSAFTTPVTCSNPSNNPNNPNNPQLDQNNPNSPKEPNNNSFSPVERGYGVFEILNTFNTILTLVLFVVFLSIHYYGFTKFKRIQNYIKKKMKAWRAVICCGTSGKNGGGNGKNGKNGGKSSERRRRSTIGLDRSNSFRDLNNPSSSSLYNNNNDNPRGKVRSDVKDHNGGIGENQNDSSPETSVSRSSRGGNNGKKMLSRQYSSSKTKSKNNYSNETTQDFQNNHMNCFICEEQGIVKSFGFAWDSEKFKPKFRKLHVCRVCSHRFCVKHGSVTHTLTPCGVPGTCYCMYHDPTPKINESDEDDY